MKYHDPRRRRCSVCYYLVDIVDGVAVTHSPWGWSIDCEGSGKPPAKIERKKKKHIHT